MKKTLLLSLAFAFSTTLLFAQKPFLIGVQGGITQSDPVNWTPLRRANTLNSIYTGSFGLNLRSRLNEKYYVQAGLHYTTLGYQTFITENIQWPSEFVPGPNGEVVYQPDPSLPHRKGQKITVDYFDLQAGVGFHILNVPQFRVGLMPFVEGNLLVGNQETIFLSYDNGKKEITHELQPRGCRNFRKFNLSAGFAFSAEFSLSPQVWLSFVPDFTYQFFALSTDADVDLSRVNYFSVGLNAGVFYQF